METEAQTKTVSILEGIREAEQEFKRRRQDYLEVERKQNELAAEVSSKQAELDMLEQKEQNFDYRLNTMNQELDGAGVVKDGNVMEVDAKKRELAELRTRLENVEND